MKAPGALTLFALVAPCAVSAPVLAAPSRDIHVLDQGWLFLQSDVANGETATDLSAWQAVTVPHSWNRVGYYLTGKGGTQTVATVNKYQGKAWYRSTFAVPRDMRGKRAWLEFDAASRRAEIWVNGTRVGAHQADFHASGLT